MFAITQGKGFSITFDNGWRISVQFGPGNYCDNYHQDFKVMMNPTRQVEVNTHSANAEVAIFDPANNFVPFEGGDTVTGHCTPDEVARYIAETAAR